MALPLALPTPAALNTVTVRATDDVGNVGLVDANVLLDSRGPRAILNQLDATRSLIDARTVQVSGVVSDASGVAELTAIFTPIRQVLAYSDTVLLLPFAESSDELWYNDRTTFHHDVTCVVSGCVLAEQPGRLGKAVRFNGSSLLHLPNAGQLDFAATTSLSMQSWLRTSQADATLLGKESGNSGYALQLTGGKLAFKLNGAVVLTSNAAVNDDQWHHVVAVVDRNSGQASLYVDGLAQGSTAFSGSLSNGGELQIGGPGYNGYLDEVAIFNKALTPFLVQGLFAAPTALLHSSATLAQPGLANTTWQAALPLGLEGQYQLDLAGVDNLNQRALNGYAWRGLIDTLAPRIHYSATLTGKSFNDANGTARAEVIYQYEAEDRYLSESGFSGPCAGRSATVRDFAADAAMGGLFPDLTLRNRLRTSCTVWELSPIPSSVVQACDRYANCATASPTLASETVKQSDSSSVASATPDLSPKATLPNAVIVAPTDHSIVAVRSGVLTMTVVAEAAQTLKEVAILLDNQPVQSIAFEQSAAVKKAQRTVVLNVANVSEGNHTLSVQASEWSGAVQQSASTIQLTLDTQEPVAVITNDTLTAADGYSLGNSMMRLRGNASDTVGLAAVQISVNQGAFADVTFDGQGDWSTAIYLGDEPAGAHFNITVRAIDLAGRAAQVVKEVTINVPALALIQTTINGGPGTITNTTEATFVFAGENAVLAASSQVVSGFQCQLDGSDFAPCSSPKQYSGLPNGEHTFRVLANDGQGNIDPSPALYVWTVDTTYTPPPTNTTKAIYLPLISRDGGSALVIAADWTVSSETVDSETVDSEELSVESKQAEEASGAAIFLPLVASAGE